MKLHFSPYPQIILFCVCKDSKGIWRVYCRNSKEAGRSCPVLDIDIRAPLIDGIYHYFKVANISLRVGSLSLRDGFLEEITSEQGLVIAELDYVTHDVSEDDWLTIPDFLRNLPKNRQRLPYLKAWQFIMGSHTGEIEALSVNDLKERILGEPCKD